MHLQSDSSGSAPVDTERLRSEENGAAENGAAVAAVRVSLTLFLEEDARIPIEKSPH